MLFCGMYLGVRQFSPGYPVRCLPPPRHSLLQRLIHYKFDRRWPLQLVESQGQGAWLGLSNDASGKWIDLSKSWSGQWKAGARVAATTRAARKRVRENGPQMAVYRSRTPTVTLLRFHACSRNLPSSTQVRKDQACFTIVYIYHGLVQL